MKDFVIGESLSDDDGGFVCPYPTTVHVFGLTERRIREGRVLPVHTDDCEGVLFTYELVGAMLPFSDKVVIGEVVAVEVLMGSTVVAIEDDEAEAR